MMHVRTAVVLLLVLVLFGAHRAVFADVADVSQLELEIHSLPVRNANAWRTMPECSASTTNECVYAPKVAEGYVSVVNRGEEAVDLTGVRAVIEAFSEQIYNKSYIAVYPSPFPEYEVKITAIEEESVAPFRSLAIARFEVYPVIAVVLDDNGDRVSYEPDQNIVMRVALASSAPEGSLVPEVLTPYATKIFAVYNYSSWLAPY